MNIETARALVSSLLGRLKTEEGAFTLPDGRLSQLEQEALVKLIGGTNTDGVTGSPTDNDISSEQNEVPDAPRIQLDVAAANRPAIPEDKLRLCLDFGTAMSKAWATGPDETETIPLVLGRSAGSGEVLAVPSSVYISQSGKLFFGEAADIQHRQDLGSGHEKFDNIKRLLSDAELGQELDEVPVPSSLDPVGSGITRGELLTLYLAWLTDMSLSALEQTLSVSDETSPDQIDAVRGIKRRFAVPCFESAIDESVDGPRRAQWVDDYMKKVILRSQLLADTLHGKWDSLNVVDARDLIKQAQKFDLQAIDHFLTEEPSIRESIAAGGSRFEDKFSESEINSRRVFLVVDAGAGTTDFAVFQAFFNAEDASVRNALISPTVKMIRCAGNDVDTVLWPLILNACGVDPNNHGKYSESDFALLKNDLASKQRSIKETLFSEGTVQIELRPNASGVLHLADVEADAEYRELSDKLNQARQSTVEKLFTPDFIENLRPHGFFSIDVLLTGGSSAVPIFAALGKGSVNLDGVSINFRPIDTLPGWIDSLEAEAAELVAQKYAQCAVAIGGSSPYRPAEISDLGLMVTPPPPGIRTLPRTPITGNG